jgi:hypothetical protein
VLTFAGGHLHGMPTLTESTFGDGYVRAITQFLQGKRS